MNAAEFQERLQTLEGALHQEQQARLRLEAQLALSRQGINASSVDTRLLGKPKTFKGRDEDWRDWSMVMRAYAGAIDSRMLNEMEFAERMETSVGHDAGLEQSVIERSVQLYYILVMTCESTALDV